jgi:hypothetical protein
MDDDTRFLGPMDGLDNDSDPTARGIVQCLRMLAEEAVALGLPRTLDALQAAMQVCAGESDSEDVLDAMDDGERGAPPGTLLN